MHRGAGGNRVGLAARRFDLGDGILPAVADADIEAIIDQPHIGAHDAAQHDVADPVVNRVLVRHPALLHQPAFEADLGSNGRDHPSVVGLDAADRHQRIGARSDGIGHDVLELPELVAAEGQAGIAILALGIKLDPAAEMGAEALQLLDRGGAEGEGIAREFREVHAEGP